MANKKRNEKMYKRELGVFNLHRKDILALEDIISKHMKSHDDIRRKQSNVSRVEDPALIDKRNYSDRYIELNDNWMGGRHISFNWIGIELQPGVTYNSAFDSIDKVPDGLKIKYLRIVGMPGVFLTFSPLRTELIVRRQDGGYAERKSMDITIRRIESYLMKRRATRNRFSITLNRLTYN